MPTRHDTCQSNTYGGYGQPPNSTAPWACSSIHHLHTLAPPSCAMVYLLTVPQRHPSLAGCSRWVRPWTREVWPKAFSNSSQGHRPWNTVLNGPHFGRMPCSSDTTHTDPAHTRPTLSSQTRPRPGHTDRPHCPPTEHHGTTPHTAQPCSPTPQPPAPPRSASSWAPENLLQFP